MLNRLKYIMIFLALLIIHNTCIADAGEVVGLAEALDFAVQNNYDLKMSKLILANKEIELKKSQLTIEAGVQISQLKGRLELLYGQEAYRLTCFEIVSGVVEDFIELTRLRQSVALTEELLQLRRMELKKVTELYKQGALIYADVQKARLAEEEEVLALRQYQESLNQLTDELKGKTGLEGEIEFAGIDLDVAPVRIEGPILLEQAFENSLDVKEKEIFYQIAEAELEQAYIEEQPVLEIARFVNNKEIARYDLLKTEDLLTRTVKKRCFDLEQGLLMLASKQNKLAIAEDSYKHTKLGFEQGVNSETEFLESKIIRTQAQMELFAAQAEFNRQKIELYYLLGSEELVGGGTK